MARRRTYAIIGLGAFGTTVATELMRFDNYVIGIDADRAAVDRLADTVSQAVILDARDDEALREAGVAECDCGVVTMGEDIASSVLAVMNLRLLGVPQVWAKALDRTHHRILTKLGVERVIHPEDEIGRHVAQVLHNPMVRDYLSLGNGYHVWDLTAPESLVGRRLPDLDVTKAHDLRCLGVMRGTEFLGDGDCSTPLEAEDKVLLLGKRADLRAFAETL